MRRFGGSTPGGRRYGSGGLRRRVHRLRMPPALVALCSLALGAAAFSMQPDSLRDEAASDPDFAGGAPVASTEDDPFTGLLPGLDDLFEPLEVAVVHGAERPFALPFGEPPGPGSWYVSQPYGNTVYAFYERFGLYKSGQGLHMGLDLAAPCGTPVLAVGDGVVLSVDGRGGAPPHNLMIDHSNGFVSFYGHLLQRPDLRVGQYVRRGEPVALSGDMYSSCVASPHLHLEIRDPSLNKVYNPVNLIEADWNGILLLGSAPLAYERDMDDPRRWQTLEDQPPIQLGGPLLNDFESPWPGDGR